ncbi:MAG: electron transfer flavoprotein subunit alpha/FixB family protein [Deltaproteobacteria bacterium]|nr:electron transfer flavoprotein subunit alpha/FixB family protein [Deltaproteobacteria bacterium]
MNEKPEKKAAYWVFAEQRQGVLHDVSLELVGAAATIARQTSASVTAVLLGRNIGGLAGELVACGANRVLVIDDERLAVYRLLPYASVLKKLCLQQDPDVFLFGATSLGVELAPRIAAMLNTGLSAHCIDLKLDEKDRLLQVVPGWGGGVLATIRCEKSRPSMATVMPGVFKKERMDDRQGEILTLPAGDDIDLSGPKVLKIEMQEPKGTSLEHADVVVAGGWGIGNAEDWKLIEELADLLCGAVGATRPPVDEGWAPEDRMIGQSGKIVKPSVYIGVGISGMMHHLVGMDASEFIIAINKDEKAAIFEVADLAVVGDFRKILPPLIREIRAKHKQECRIKLLAEATI